MLTFRFSAADAVMTIQETLTSGMVGKSVNFEFASDWANLTKTIVYENGSIIRTVAYSEDGNTIPDDVLAVSGNRLFVGAFGESEDGALMIPTIFARGPHVQRGADPLQAPAGEPPLASYARLMAMIGDMDGLKTDAKASLVAAVNELYGKIGTGSNNGNNSGQNVELDTTLTQSGKAADAKAVGDALASKLDSVMVSPDGSKWRITISNEGVMTSEKIIIEIPATGIALSASTLTFNSSANQTIKATLTPADSTDAVVWETSNSDVATVSNGVVTPVGNGSCTITATAGSVSASCAITVDVAVVETYSITRNITNATGFDDSAVIGKGSELLECYVSNDECTMDGATATVTMDGVDITETAWDNGVVNIAEVTGDVVITLDAVKIQYVVPPMEDFTLQLYENTKLLVKAYVGTEKAIEMPTSFTYNDKEYPLVSGTKRLKDSIIVIWHGTNGYGTDGYDGVTAKMVAALDGNQRYLLIPPTSEGEGDEVYESWVATYGEEHVLSMGDWFANNGYTVSEYQTDGCHFTDEGYALVAQAICEKIQHWL